MTQVCINKICFEFSVYHFIFLAILIILGNLVLDYFKSKNQKITEKLFNINYDIPEVDIYPGQYLTRSTLQTKSGADYDELTKSYDKYAFTKPRLTSEPPPDLYSSDGTNFSSSEYPKHKGRSSKEKKSSSSSPPPPPPYNPPPPPKSKKTLQPLVPLNKEPGRSIPSTNYPDDTPTVNGPMRAIPMTGVQLPNGGLTDYELIKQRDLGVLANPLLPPERRTERPTIDMTLPLLRDKYIGLPTRGSYDTYQNTGYLVDETNQENILKLFGRQKYPGSNQYEYYAIKSTHVDQIKVPLYHVKKQLFDDDIVKLTKLFPGSYKFMEFKQEELI